MTVALKSRKPAPAVRMASGLRVVSYSLADPEMAVRVAAFRAKLTSSPEQGVKLLKRAGIMNKSGKTAKSYGG